MLTISVWDKKYEVILNILKIFSNVFGTYGIHPHETKNHKDINKDIILKKISLSKKLLELEKPVWIFTTIRDKKLN